MANLRNAIWNILLADAQLHTGTELGSLLGHYATAPYGLYWGYPPTNPDLPVLAIRTIGEMSRRPRDIMVEVIAWAENYEAILARVRALLHDTPITCDDFVVLMLKWDGAGTELFDDDLKSRTLNNRYWVKGWTK